MTNILLVMLVKRALLITASFHSPLVNERQTVSEHLLPIPCTYKTAEWKKMKITRTYILPLAGDVGEESLVNHGVVSLLFQLQPKQCARLHGARLVAGVHLKVSRRITICSQQIKRTI